MFTRVSRSRCIKIKVLSEYQGVYKCSILYDRIYQMNKVKWILLNKFKTFVIIYIIYRSISYVVLWSHLLFRIICLINHLRVPHFLSSKFWLKDLHQTFSVSHTLNRPYIPWHWIIASNNLATRKFKFVTYVLIPYVSLLYKLTYYLNMYICVLSVSDKTMLDHVINSLILQLARRPDSDFLVSKSQKRRLKINH